MPDPSTERARPQPPIPLFAVSVLTLPEHGLLKMFITHPNKLLTPGMLLHQVWGAE